ncbi:MAG: LysE family translocator, partial [Candidatus Latescibacterota bacterium]
SGALISMHLLPPEVLLPFFAAATALALAPGPDNLFVLTQSLQHGRAAGWSITLGLCSGLVLHTSAVALGLAAVLQKTPLALNAIQSVGALYLLYLAQSAWRTADQALHSANEASVRLGVLYRHGIFMNATNPKVALFFLAFLPQFTDPMRGALSAQMGQLGLVFIAATMLVFGGIALLAGTLCPWLARTPHAQRTTHRIAAGVFVALALRLIFTME